MNGWKAGALGAALLGMAGCMDPAGEAMASRSADDPAAAEVAAATTLNPLMADDSNSDVIESLLNRSSVLQAGALSDVADAVLAANTRPAEAELRAAVLRAEATQLNWLPTLGPQVSLNSLGDLVSSIVLDAVLWDNGAKRAERELAKTDVEVAAVALAEDTNDRVETALGLYIDAQSARAAAAVTEAGVGQMQAFVNNVAQRVEAGVSIPADLSLVRQRLNQMESDLATDREAATSALAELSAMTARPLSGVRGLSGVGRPSPLAEPLSVTLARARADRAVSEAVIARSGYLPQVSASGRSDGSDSSGAITVAAPNGLGFGRGKSLEAIEAERQAADARVGDVQEDAMRELNRLEADMASLERQKSQAQGLAAEAARNYAQFLELYEAGLRDMTDLIGVFATKVQTEREAVRLDYDIAKMRVRIAAVHGALVDGDKI